jgi:hypothetical protein
MMSAVGMNAPAACRHRTIRALVIDRLAPARLMTAVLITGSAGLIGQARSSTVSAATS